MKIWLFGSYDQPFGQSNRSHLFSEFFSREHDVTFFCNSFCHFRKRQIKRPFLFTETESIGAYRACWLNTPGYKGNGVGRIINAIVNFALLTIVGLTKNEKPDVIIGTSVPITTAFSAALVAKLRGAKFVYDIRDVWPEALVSLGGLKRGSLTHSLLLDIEKRVFSMAALVVSTLPNVEGHARESGFSSQRRLVWIPNPSTGVSAHAEPISLRCQDKFSVVYVGGFGRFHNISVIIEAARICQVREFGIAFHLFGDGEFLEGFRSEAKKNGLRNIFFYGRIERFQVDAAHEAADSLVATVPASDLFQFGINPNKIVNYLSSKKPILYAGPVVPKNPILESGCGICVGATDGEALAIAANEIRLMTSDARREMGLRAFKYFHDHYRLDVLGHRFVTELAAITRSDE